MAKAGKGSAQQKFGRYNALTKLGQGAMATVYLAEDPSLNRMVAIKVIHTHLSGNASLLDRFTVEAKTAASLRNPNIVEIFDYGIENSAQYLVMEYIDGPNLQFVLNLLGGNPMEPEVCAAIICQAADGLITAEKFGVVHRDIKPENLMFKSEGALKIADFGIAHISEQNLTQTGSILGSPNFMSPEQIDGQKPNHMTDMFSLGVVFYYCLSGRKPFTGANIPTIMRHICDMPHAPLSSIMPDVDPVLEKLVDTLLQKAPEDRGKGARWLSLQLRGYLSQKGVFDLTEVTKKLLEGTGNMGNHTVVDLTPAPSPDAPRKAPLKPGMKIERSPKPGTGIRSGTGIKSGGRQGTWHPGNNQEDGSDFSGDGASSGGGKKNLFMWLGAGVVGLSLLIMALVLVLGNGKKNAKNRDGEEANPTPKSQALEAVSLQPGSMELQAGQRRKFILEVQPEGAPRAVRWESVDPLVATVQDGEVTGHKPGQTTIRAISLQDGSKQGTAEVIIAGEVRTDEPMPNPISNPITRPDPVRNPEPIAQPNQKARPIKEIKPVAKEITPPKTQTPVNVNPVAKDTEAGQPVATKTILTITSAPPFAEVIIDGRFIGTTPVKAKEIPPGKHKVQITHRSFPTVDTVVTFKAGEKKLHFRLFR